MADTADAEAPCACLSRPPWARIEDDSVMRWPVVEAAEWEELRQCPDCSRAWLAVWPEEMEGAPILCRPDPQDVRRLRDVDHVSTLRHYCLDRLSEHFGELKENKVPCKKVDCERHRIRGASYCLEHLIAQRFGRHLARIERPEK